MASAVDTAIVQTVALLKAGATGTLVGASSVIDGPFVTGDDPETAVFVGYDGDPEGDYQATENWEQTWAGLGALRKNEAFDLLCCVISWSGEVDVPTRRQRAIAAIGAVEADLRGDVDLSLPSPTRVAFTSGQLFQEQDPSRGLQARIPFSINVQTRI